MVEDVEKIVFRYNKLRSEEPLLDERVALEKAFYQKDFVEDPLDRFHSIIFDFISDLNDNPELVEDFLTEDISKKPSTLRKLAKARLEKHQRKMRQKAGVSKRRPEAQALKKLYEITPETATPLLQEEIKIGETIIPIQTPAITQAFQTPTIEAISGLTDRQMTPVQSSFVKGVGAYKGHLLIEYHHDPNIWGYAIGGEKAGNWFNEILMSGSKGGWVWDKLLGKPSIYGMAKGKFFAVPQDDGTTNFFTTKGAQFVHLEGRPAKFTYNPVGYQGGEQFYDQQSKVWQEYKEKIVSPPKSRELAEIKLIEQEQQRGVKLQEELRQLFKQKFGLDFELEDKIILQLTQDSLEGNFNEIKDYITDALIDLGSEESKEWNKAIIEDSNNITTWEGLRDLFVDVITDIATEESEEWRKVVIEDSDNYTTPKEIINFIRDVISDVSTQSKEWLSSFESGLKEVKGKGKGWHGDPEGHSQAAKKGKKLVKEMKGTNLTHKHDFIDFSNFKLDFTEDYTHIYGPITHGRKGGHFDYKDPEDPKKVIRLYKDYKSLKEVHENLDYYPIIGTQGKGSHKARLIGFTYGYEPRDDTEEIYAHT